MHKHIILPTTPTLVEEIAPNQATYSIEPLNPGYGVTVANSLRRVMLSSLPGAAVTYYKIKGVDHEFTTIPNVLEDVIDITLNIKSLRFSLTNDEPVTLSVKASGSKAVTGKDITLPAGVELINKDAHILTLTDKDASLEMELIVEKGVGFKRGTEQNTQSEVGLIAVDSIFTPVVRVSYDVQDLRVGDKTNYNKALFTITTDGTITPIEVIEESARILVEQFSALVAGGVEVAPQVAEEEGETEIEASQIKLDTLGFTQRILKALEAEGITNLAELARLSKKQLLEIKGLSERSFDVIEHEVKEFGIEFDK